MKHEKHDSHEHKHHGHDSHDHSHSHGSIDPSIISSDRGLWAVKWSFVGLLITALFQIVVVYFSGSIALLADTIHNVGDAATAVPLGIAFAFAKLKPSKRFTYGYGRIEDLAGVAVVLTILASAIIAGYESVQRFFHPQIVTHLGAVIAASLVGFAGNEVVAVFRINVGKEIGSAALIADGYHARIDGFTSLAVLFGAIGVWLGFPLADPLVGLLITVTILKIVWDSVKLVFTRMLDGVEPDVLYEVNHAVEHVRGVKQVGEIKARWVGHKLYVELNIAVGESASAKEGHEIANEVRHQLLHHLPHLGHVRVHVDTENNFGGNPHGIDQHQHGHLPPHSHE